MFLYQKVLEGRQEQIIDKLEEVRQQQQESLERREQLLNEIEIANQLTRREQEKVEAERKELKLNLEEQVRSLFWSPFQSCLTRIKYILISLVTFVFNLNFLTCILITREMLSSL